MLFYISFDVSGIIYNQVSNLQHQSDQKSFIGPLWRETTINERNTEYHIEGLRYLQSVWNGYITVLH